MVKMRPIDNCDGLSVTLLILLGVLGPAAGSDSDNSRIISVIWDEGNWRLEEGVSADFTVVANLTETRTESGWDHLDIRSRGTLGADLEDEQQALAAGIAEGYLTHDLILSYYREFIHKKLCSEVKLYPFNIIFLFEHFQDPSFCDFIRQKFQDNLDWMNTILEAQEGRSSTYWKMTSLFHSQLRGLQIGWLMRMKEEKRSIPDDFDVTWFAYFINFYPDIGDYLYSYNKIKVSWFPE